MAATWKKVIVSGSTANLANLQVDGLTSGQVVIGGGTAGNLTTTAINGTGNILATTGATGVSISGSFSGSFFGSGAGLSGVTATAIFPTTQRTNVTNVDKFFISQSTGQEYINYGDLLTDLAGTNLVVESNDSLTLATTITGITSITSTSFTGSLLGTASYASNANLLDGIDSTAFLLNSQTSSMLTPYVLTSQTSSMSVLSASYAVSSSYAFNSTSASFASTVGSISSNVTNNTDNYILTATGGGNINGESNLTFNGSLLTVSGNTLITGDLTVAGTASFTNTDNLNIRDKFILINSGSSTLADSGWVTQYNAAGSGSAFYLEATSAGTYGRFAVAYDAIGTATSIAADEYVVTAKVNQSAPGAATPTWGGSGTNGQGNMWLTSTGDIYIWA
jgi:hypothetical protein